MKNSIKILGLVGLIALANPSKTEESISKTSAEIFVDEEKKLDELIEISTRDTNILRHTLEQYHILNHALQSGLYKYLDKVDLPLTAIFSYLDNNFDFDKVPLSLKKYHATIVQASNETGLPKSLLYAIMSTESAGNSNAVSSKNAQGLMQMDPITQRHMKKKTGNNFNPFNADQSINNGAHYLKSLFEHYNNTQIVNAFSKALSGWNAGPTVTDSSLKQTKDIPPYYETKMFIAKVLKQIDKYSLTNQDYVMKDNAYW